MADEPTNQQPISDDQELAKVLAGVTAQTDAPIEEPIVTTPVPDPVVPAPVEEEPTVEPVVAPVSVTPSSSGELDGIKLEALNELRPLVDKLNVSPEEKFDTYLLLLRSTDDRDLIAPAHEAAKNIADEARRAQALLDIIKEIDFLSQSQAAAA
ncbi:MAG TPA: hypothetical protein VGE34_04300 [Candidatus Saccharimonadales bacterium]